MPPSAKSRRKWRSHALRSPSEDLLSPVLDRNPGSKECYAHCVNRILGADMKLWANTLRDGWLHAVAIDLAAGQKKTANCLQCRYFAIEATAHETNWNYQHSSSATMSFALAWRAWQTFLA